MRIRIPLLVLLACFTPLARAAVCPSNQMGNVTSTLPIDSYGTTYTRVSYNVPAGTLSLNMSMCGELPECGTGAVVIVEDDFSLFGLPAGTPVSLTAHFAGTLGGGFGDTGSYAVVRGHLKDALGGQQDATGPSSFDLALPVAAIAGQTFRLHFELEGYTLQSSGGGDATFSFTGIPPGAAVTSCQGYVSDRSVPARAMSWGRLKTHYR
jgi:hypothetical protein